MNKILIENKIKYKEVRSYIKKEQRYEEENVYIFHLNKLMFKNKIDFFKLQNDIKAMSKLYFPIAIISVYEENKIKIEDINDVNENIEQFCYDNNVIFLDYDYYKTNEGKLDINKYLEKNFILSEDYSFFTKYYRKNQNDIEYSKWVEGIDLNKIEKILDLGCGYAPYAKLFKSEKYLGIDLSSDMVESAKIENPGYNFEVGNMINYETKADLIISFLDCINYLNEEELNKTFKNLFNSLTNNGIAIIDFHDEEKVNKFKNYFFYDETDNELFRWISNIRGDSIVHMFILEKDDKVYIEKHIQKIYSKERIIKNLKDVGLTVYKEDRYYDHVILKIKRK